MRADDDPLRARGVSRLWLFNLDAEEELAGRPPAGAREEAVARLAEPLAHGRGGLLAPRDTLVGAPGGPGPVERSGVAWCPTPSACAQLESAGAAVPPAPAVEVLRRANARETFVDLDPLPGACIVGEGAELRRVLSSEAPGRAPGSGRPPAWLLRRSLGSAGRGRLVVERWGERAELWASTALAEGPVHVAPLVDLVEEFALHGRVAPDGSFALGSPVLHRAVGGTFRGAERATFASLGADRTERLVQAASAVGERLAGLGYRGPFGVDAFAWMDGRGARRFHAPSEVNARYTMSFGIGAPELV
ncbi:MAG: hypothetical protein AAGB93_23350 [Planctomycetota bacterium]